MTDSTNNIIGITIFKGAIIFHRNSRLAILCICMTVLLVVVIEAMSWMVTEIGFVQKLEDGLDQILLVKVNYIPIISII